VFWRRKTWEDDYDRSYGDRPRREHLEGPTWWIHITLLVAIWILFIGGIWAIAGRTMAEKSLRLFATPLGLVWIIFVCQIYFAALVRKGVLFLLGLIPFLVLTAGGNYFVQRGLVHSLESEYLSLNPLAGEAFDVLIVLGGGSDNKPNGHPQLLRGGERVAIAAEMYHAGKVSRIVATGKNSVRRDEKDQDPCEETRQILIELKVPEAAIMMLRGINTSEEAAACRQWLDELGDNQPKRIGLVTSAWHLKRATALFEKNGIPVEPVPADFFLGPFRPSASMIVPSSENLEIVSIALHEYFGRWIGR
jgi:uncharacterized SAM-binding protein YcdF (DUF218 family)